jgi:hypothetical protein
MGNFHEIIITIYQLSHKVGTQHQSSHAIISEGKINCFSAREEPIVDQFGLANG